MSKPRIQLVLDFDGTITVDDTTAVIGSRCLAKARELAPPEVLDEMLPKSMEHYSNLYMQEYHRAKQALWDPSGSKSIDDEVSWLSEIAHVERDSFMRVRNAILHFPGDIQELEQDDALRNEFMMESGRQAVRSGEVRIRDPEALRQLINTAQSGTNNFGVVSVSWSRSFIIGAMIEAGLVKASQREGIASEIRCNELLTPVAPDRIICSARDKHNEFLKLLEEWQAFAGSQGKDEAETLTIYIGDSTTDLGCLASADIGMYVQAVDPKEDKVLPILERLRVQPVRVTDLPTSNTPVWVRDTLTEFGQENKPPLICFVRGLEDVNEWISKLRLIS